MKKRIFPRAMAYSGCALFALTTASLAQDTEPKDVTVQVRHESKDSEVPPVTQENEPFVLVSAEAGYWSEYNFRGTNLMPGSDGGAVYQARATFPKLGPGTLTMGIWGIHQIGTASVKDWSISEGGGAAGEPEPIGTRGTEEVTRFPVTTQTSFHEIDLFIYYRFPLGPVDITLGNIAFFIDRKSQTFETDFLESTRGTTWPSTRSDPNDPSTGSNTRIVGPLATVNDEQIDRIYIRLSTNKLSRYITPTIAYFQTIYTEGTQPTRIVDTTLPPYPADPTVGLQPNHERNEKLGGYLEGRVDGNFPVAHWMAINPWGLIGVSFSDRTEPGGGNPFSGQPLTGFNHTQAGVELEFRLTRHISFLPYVAYSYHISPPPTGTDRNEFWGGAKVAVHF